MAKKELEIEFIEFNKTGIQKAAFVLARNQGFKTWDEIPKSRKQEYIDIAMEVLNDYDEGCLLD